MIKFVCPNCGCTVLEEVMTDCTVTTPVSKIEDELEYENNEHVEINDGFVERYQCKRCDFVIRDYGDIDVQYPEDLALILKEKYNMKKI